MDAINNEEQGTYAIIHNKVTTYYKPRFGDAKISRFVYFGHGAPGELMIRFNPINNVIKPKPLLITGDDIEKGFINRGIFMKGAIAHSCGCNTATPPSDGKQSFTEVWKEYFGFAMSGVRSLTGNPEEGRTDYGNIESPTQEGEVPQIGKGGIWEPSGTGKSPLL